MLVIGCASSNIIKQTDPYKTLTSEYVKESCTPPQEYYPMRVLGVPTLLTRHDNCHDVNDLVLISWMGDFDEIGMTTTGLLSLHFAEFLNERQKQDCKMLLLKRENGPVQRIHVSFYSVTCQVTKQNEQ